MDPRGLTAIITRTFAVIFASPITSIDGFPAGNVPETEAYRFRIVVFWEGVYNSFLSLKIGSRC